MNPHRLKEIFAELNQKLLSFNEQRAAQGLVPHPKAEVILLGQMSLLIRKELAAVFR